METQENSQAIKDKFFLTHILFYALGTVTLIPMNFFITATDYWMFKFRDPQSNESYNSGNRTGLQAEFTADFSIASHVSNAIFIVVSILLVKKSTIQVKMIGGIFGAALMFGLTCIFVKIDTDSWQMGFMVLTLIIGFVLAACCSLLLVTVFQMSSQFPPTYVPILVAGQAFCGILSALAQIISLSVNDDPAVKGIVFFGSACFFVSFTLIAFVGCVKKCQFFKHYFNKKKQTKDIQVSKEMFLTILKKIKYYLLAMFISSGSSIMIHPSVTALVVSVDKGNGNKWNDVYFGPVITFLVYNIADYLGRQLAVVFEKPSHGLTILGMSLVRLVLIPMILFCNAQPRDHLSVIFDVDYAYIIFIIILGFFNGYIMNLCVYYVTNLPTEEEKPLAVFTIMIFMIVSMAVCSFGGNGMVQAL